MLGEIDGRHSLVGFAAAAAIIVVLLWVVGFDEVAAAFALVRPAALLAVAGVALLWMLAWALGLRTVLAMLDIRIPVTGAFLIQAAVQFTNNVTPFGQAGGEPISALFISRTVDAEYETGLAAIASVDAINFLPSIAFALVGLAYYAVVFTLGPRLRQAAVVIALVIVVLAAIGYAAWRYRDRLEELSVRALAPVLRVAGRALPFRRAPDRAVVRAHVRGFYRDVGRLTDQPGRLAVAIGYSAAGWLCLVGSLWLSLYSLGYPVPVAVLLVVIPLGAVASIAPLPGGLGGIEAVLVLVLVPTTGVPAAVAGAAVIVHRAAVYWLPVVVGGAAAAFLSSGVRFDSPSGE